MQNEYILSKIVIQGFLFSERFLLKSKTFVVFLIHFITSYDLVSIDRKGPSYKKKFNGFLDDNLGEIGDYSCFCFIFYSILFKTACRMCFQKAFEDFKMDVLTGFSCSSLACFALLLFKEYK